MIFLITTLWLAATFFIFVERGDCAVLPQRVSSPGAPESGTRTAVDDGDTNGRKWTIAPLKAQDGDGSGEQNDFYAAES